MPTHKALLQPEDELVEDKVAAEILGISNFRTLSNWRAANKHPDLAYLRIGRSIRYRVGDLLDFRHRHTVGGVKAVEPVAEHAAQAASTQIKAPTPYVVSTSAAIEAPNTQANTQQTSQPVSQALASVRGVRPSDLVRQQFNN